MGKELGDLLGSFFTMATGIPTRAYRERQHEKDRTDFLRRKRQSEIDFLEEERQRGTHVEDFLDGEE